MQLLISKILVKYYTKSLSFTSKILILNKIFVIIYHCFAAVLIENYVAYLKYYYILEITQLFHYITSDV